MNTDKREKVLAEAVWYFVGLDLGQSQDHSALAVVERADLVLDEVDHATYERMKERRYRVRFLERVALGTPYPAVVERVRAMVRAKPLAGQCTLVVDATGVGAPVVDLLQQAQLGCRIEPVILTGGEWESRTEGVCCVPKQDLVAGLRLMLENREFGITVEVCAVATSGEGDGGDGDVDRRPGWAEFWGAAGGGA